MVQSYIPKTAKACPCPCHRFGGHLPMPRDQAVMPYWVPQVLRSHKKVRGRLVWQQGLKVRGGAEGEPEIRGRVPGSFPTVASLGVWGSPPSCGLGQQRTGDQWYSGQAQVRCAGGVGKGGIHRTLRRVCCHLSHRFFCPSSSPSPPFSSLFSILASPTGS